jgi:hypothetical protein
MNTVKTPQGNLEAFLHNEVNIDILETLFPLEDAEEDKEMLLNYFNLLFSEFTFFNENVGNYLEIKKHFPTYYDDLEYEIIENDDELLFNKYDLHVGLVKLLDFHYPIETREGVILKSCKHIQRVFKLYDDKAMGEHYRQETEYKTSITSTNSIIRNENTLQWQGSTLEFSEFTKALIESGFIGKVKNEKEVFARMKHFFNVDDFDKSDKLSQIRKRSKDLTPTINSLEVSLTNWIKKKD